MKRPLYLDGGHPVRIEYEEGPALAITRRGEATRLMPLGKISHIIARGHAIDWAQQALFGCVENDIPVFLVDSEDHLTGVLRASHNNPEQDWHRLMRILEDPDGIDSYQLFLKGKQSQIQLDITQRWRPNPETRLPGYFRAARIVRNAIRCDLETELHRRGFRRRLPLLRQAGIDLAADFTKLLEPGVHWILNESWITSYHRDEYPQPPRARSRREILHGYEKNADLIRDTLRALVVAFLYWMAEQDSESIVYDQPGSTR